MNVRRYAGPCAYQVHQHTYVRLEITHIRTYEFIHRTILYVHRNYINATTWAGLHGNIDFKYVYHTYVSCHLKSWAIAKC